jgi:CelD/BcsL family acetyltransferase involved in cellulose biosynthesis
VTDAAVALGAVSDEARSQASPLRVERVEALEDVRDDWEALASATRNVFSTWEWASLWWKRFGESRTLFVHACRSADGRAVGILPLYLWQRRPFRVVRFVGHGEADQLGPICLPEHRPAVADALRSLLADARADVFLAERMAREEGWGAPLGAGELRAEPSPVVRFDVETWEEFLRTRSRNFRDQARRRERRLAEQHEIRFRLAADPETLDQDLDALFSLHRARWSGTQTDFGRREAFHREFAARALERGWLRLWLLEVDGHPRAAIHGFRLGDVESFYQSGRDPAFDDRSVGFVVLLHAIREALTDGMSEYRLLLGGEAYKYRFANDDREVVTVATTRTRRAHAVLSGAVAARRSRAKLRSWRETRGEPTSQPDRPRV